MNTPLHSSAAFSGVASVPAVEQIIKLGAGVSIDGYLVYRLKSWEPRYSLNYVSILLGYAEDYFLRLTKKSVKKAEALRHKGYTDVRIPVKRLRDGKRGATIVQTISFDDFCLIVEYEAEIGNRKAFALLTASFRELLLSRTQAAFSLPESSLEQKQIAFQINYQTYLEDRAELEALRLPGDDDCYPVYLDWENIQPWGLSYFEKEYLYSDHL